MLNWLGALTPRQIRKTVFGLVKAAPLREKCCAVLIYLRLTQRPTLLATGKNDVDNPVSSTAILRVGRNTKRSSQGNRGFTNLTCGPHIGVNSIVIVALVRPDDDAKVTELVAKT